jgi:hypothetical protein
MGDGAEGEAMLMISRSHGAARVWIPPIALLLACSAGSVLAGSDAIDERGEGPAPDSVEWNAAQRDAAVEHFLRVGKITEIRDIDTGVTRPQRVTLALDGKTRTAVFKSVDIQKPGVTRLDSGPVMNFSDRYHYEVAAYLLDRELRLNMVPVSVLRPVRGTNGVLVEWIGDTYSATEAMDLLENGVPGASDLLAQRKLMWLFDALIHNTDRHLGNGVVTKSDWRLHLIDHTRAFRYEKTLHGPFAEHTASLPRTTYTRLQGLEEKKLREMLKGLLNKRQVRALLARRDKILEKIEEDRQRLGDRLVFQD